MRRIPFITFLVAIILSSAVSAAAFAGAGEKNYGVPAPGFAPQTLAPAALSSPSSPFHIGDRVRALVNGPSGSDCIQAGDTGTIMCYDAADASLPYLVDWDRSCGFPQNAVCGNLAEHGWWVGFSEVELASQTSSGPAVFDWSTARLILTPVQIVNNPLVTPSTWNLELQLVPGGPFDPVRFELISITPAP